MDMLLELVPATVLAGDNSCVLRDVLAADYRIHVDATALHSA